MVEQPTNSSANSVYDFTPTPVGEKGYKWAQIINAVLTSEYLERLSGVLRERSSLPELITLQLYEHLARVYQHKVEVIFEQQGIEALDLHQPHLNLVNSAINSQETRPQVEVCLDEAVSKAHLKEALLVFFERPDFREEFAKAIGSNLVVWALEEIETAQGENHLDTLSAADLKVAIGHYIDDSDSPEFDTKLNIFGQIYCQDITQTIIEGLNLPACSLQDLEQVLGLRQRPAAALYANLDLAKIFPIPTAIPIASSIKAQLRPELWQRNGDDLAVFTYQSKGNPANFIEHYITNPGDIALLPWEAAEQIINKFGFNTVKLQLIFAARTMAENEPWKSSFTLKATDIIHLLGWDRNHNTSIAEKRNMVAAAAFALSCLMVKSVWIEGRGKRKLDASIPVGRMWDVLIDSHGQIDLTTKKIDRPEEIYITVSPGGWTKHFLNRAGNKAREALYQFGFLARDILKIDPYHNELALRLAIQLTLDARVRARNRNPYEYKVVHLLEEAIPRRDISLALDDKYKARDLRRRWDKALLLLEELGWEIEYDPETYPEWIRPNSDATKPKGWRKVKVIERILQAKLDIRPPHPIPVLLTKLKDPKPQKTLAPEPVSLDTLTGEMIKQGRQERGWTRKELAGFLGISQDYVGKLERGDRPVTEELETRLRKLLKLKSA
ncbi:helix-turn-helix transcriptional regulator [Halomicronema sp. CCY15110]|uniref:helix-turn-helix domain-containing protein n=1 Tax=Halomicronema sp. CCY15110 TaxID=2767773 RepID=UPI0019505425|nr:helix-turn-helix transcriptional regulator [Halomicronema sp. CCY15110]